MDPSEAVDVLFKGANSVFSKALNQWSQNGKNSASKKVPNKFVIIAEGVAGLAAREYIQSKEYQGEIDNVLFFNTPHEGSGFADQTLLNGSSVLNKAKSVSDYSDVIPLALAVYLVGGSDALENLMMSLLKEAVLGMAQNAGDIKKNFSSYFEDADKTYKSMLYLAQDLDLNDDAYNEVKQKAQEKRLELKNYVGSTQLLNSYSKMNVFDHPAYNNIYSYGLPTIGNGRRTLADFADQAKNHVSKEKIQKVLTEAVAAKVDNIKDEAKAEIENIISEAMKSDLAASALQTASDIANKYKVPAGEIAECIQDVSTLSKLKFNKENLSSSVMKVISIANKYLPEKYKSELFSTFIDEYSEKIAELNDKLKSVKEDMKKGMEVVSNNLSNYAINFFEEGTFDVSAISAIGKNVQAFKESSVSRIGYSLSDFVQSNKSKFTDLNSYMDRVSEVGKLEELRGNIDDGLKIACVIAETANPGAGKACRAGQFMANVALIAKVSSDIENAMKMIGSLKNAKYIAVEQSINRKNKYSSWRDHNGTSKDIESSDMESMLFGTPIVSLQTVRKSSGSADSIVPLALYKTFGDVNNYLDISKDGSSYDYLFPASEFSEISRNSLTNSNAVMIKDAERYAALDGFIVRDFIQEYRFIVDDFQPDELRLIKFDFNARMQIAYERDGNLWNIYRGVDNKWETKPIGTLSKSPVTKDGFFVFRPKEILNKDKTTGKDSILLSAIQEDGANNISIYVVNKVGYANNQRITFLFQAVDYLLEEGWPKSFEKVSRMDTVDFYANDLGYGADTHEHRITVVGPDFVDSTINVQVDSVPGSGHRYRYWADLTSIWKQHPLQNSTYTLKWNLAYSVKTLKADNSIGSQEVKYTPQTIVWGDTSKPILEFDTTLSPYVVSSKKENGIAYVVAKDSVDERALRNIRGFIVRKNAKDTIMLLQKENVNERFYEIGWNGKNVSWSGIADLYVQAYDFSNPSKAMKNAIAKISSDSAWREVLTGASFVDGINGTVIHKQILVDNAAPQILNDSVSVLSFHDAALPAFTKQNDGADYVLNALDTLRISFDVDENLFGRTSENIVAELTFADSIDNGNVKKIRYLLNDSMTQNNRRFVFVEPEVNRLGNGVYSLTVAVTDEAGNSSSKKLISKLRVDRSAPQIRGVTLGDVAYGSVAELKKGTGYLSQSLDDVRNRSDLSCFVKVNTDKAEGPWTGPFAETNTKVKADVNFIFDIKSAVIDTSHGFWYVYLGCYDHAGNFGKNMNFMGVGNRYPEITLPDSTPTPHSGRILVRGIAPNPDVNGNDNVGEFRLSWRNKKDSMWYEDGLSYLVFDKSLSVSERDLAVWNTADAKLSKDDYVLKLSVRSCDTCAWISNERNVIVDDYVVPSSIGEPKLVVNLPTQKHVAGNEQSVSIELMNVADTSKWFVYATIEAPSPRDSSVYIKAVEKSFDSMILSPFRTPAVASDTGLSIWQESDDSTWHVRYAGNASGIMNRGDSTSMNPFLVVRFVDGKIDFGTSPNADSTETLGFVMDSIKVHIDSVPDFTVPAYNTTKKWLLGKDSVHLVFKTASSFTVDVSSVDGALYKDSLSPVVYVHPEEYKAHVVWNGLVNKMYPSGSLVKMHVLAYEKGNEQNIISEDAEWYLEYQEPKIEISSNNLEKYYIDFLKNMKDSSKVKTADFGFQFKLTGRSAYVTADIIDSDKKSVYSLLDSELVLATNSNQWNTLQWNGVKDDKLMKPGSYNVRLVVTDAKGKVIDSLYYPFSLSLGTNLVEAPKDSSKGIVADLKMEEAFLDEFGDYRYVGKADYLLRSDLVATVLPEKERTFYYTWDVYGGTQRPTMYKKTRPSLGIRRSRDEFKATVVTLVMGETRGYNGRYRKYGFGTTECKSQSKYQGYFYRIQVKQITFKKNEKKVGVTFDLDPVNNTHNDALIYGFVNHSNILDLRIDTLNALAAIKIFPASSYKQISVFLSETGFNGNAVEDVGQAEINNLAWIDVYKKDQYLKTNKRSPMSDWFTNWQGQPLYYEAVIENFNVFAKSVSLNNNFNQVSSAKTVCETDQIKDPLADDDLNFVCGAKRAVDEIDTAIVARFNPHAYMVNVSLEPVDGKENLYDNNYDEEHCSYTESGTDIKVKFVLEMNPEYWDPKPENWGTNNLANRYVRFDPINKTLYGGDGYVTKLANQRDSNFYNFYNGNQWVSDGTFDNGPTVFEAQRLPMKLEPENPLLFNDEINGAISSSNLSWRFYLGSGDVAYKAEAKGPNDSQLAVFTSNDEDAVNGLDKDIGSVANILNCKFDVAPMMTKDSAELAGIVYTDNSFAVAYPYDNGTCTLPSDKGKDSRFYGCDKWVSRVHYKQNDWTEQEWEAKFLENGYYRNPLIDASVNKYFLVNSNSPANAGVAQKIDSVKVDSVTWSAELQEPSFGINNLLSGKYVLKSDSRNSDNWDIDSSKSGNGIRYTISNNGQFYLAKLDFYRSKDSIFVADTSLNNGISLKRVVNQNQKDSILSTNWAKNISVGNVAVYKRNMEGDTNLIEHPYFKASYDSLGKQFNVNRTSLDVYASREDEIISLLGRVPYAVCDWNVSYIQDGMRFNVAGKKTDTLDTTVPYPIKVSKNVNELQGNTSFFLTYSGLNNITYYRQLDVRIGKLVKPEDSITVYSSYHNVSVHFNKGSWEKNTDVTVRTMDPSECYDCELFRNMVPVGPVIEVLPSHKFAAGKEPLVTMDISRTSLEKDNVDPRNLKIYKPDVQNKKLVPLETFGLVYLDSNLVVCKDTSTISWSFVRITAKTSTFSKFVALDSLMADSVEIADSIPEEIGTFSCSQMDSLWGDTLWMGTANGWLEYPYLCDGKSNYLLQLKNSSNVAAEHHGASERPIIWRAKNTDLNQIDSLYQSFIVFYGLDGNTEQKLGPVVKLDSTAPVIENVDISVSDNGDERIVHVAADVYEAESKLKGTTMELFLGGSLVESITIPENGILQHDFNLKKKDLYECIACMATITVIAEDYGHNTDKVVKQTEKLYPYPSSLVLWYPLAEGAGNIAYEIMTKDKSRRLHMDLSSVNKPWGAKYGVNLTAKDSASSRYILPALDTLRPFSFEFNFNSNNTQREDWSILSFVGKNEWTFGLGTYNRYFLKVGSEQFYFNTKREANIPTHLVVVVDGTKASLYKNGKYEETIKLSKELFYGGYGKLSIGARNGVRSAGGSISNLRFYSSALAEEQIQSIFEGVLSVDEVNFAAVRAVDLEDRDGLVVDQSCSAPGKAYLRQKSIGNDGVMTWNVDLNADNYSLYLLHRNYVSEDSRVEILVNGNSVGEFKLTSTGLWKSEKIVNLGLSLNSGVNEIGVRPLGNLGVAAIALASSSANIEDNQISYNESSWVNPDPRVKVLMKYESLEDKKWAQVRFDLRNMTDKSFENARIRYYYKGEGENVNATSFFPDAPMSVVNDAGSVFYAEFALTETIAAYGTAYFGQGPLIGLHRITSPDNNFPYWDKTDDPSYLKDAESGYANATGVALLDGDGNLLNEFACYDEDGPVQKAKIKVRAMAMDYECGSASASNLAVYVENTGSAPVDGFEMRYYFRDSAKTEFDVNWSAFATSQMVNAGGDLYYISFMYDVLLNPGDKSDYGSGVQFAVHHPNRTIDFNAKDDPSHYNLNNYGMVEADSVVVLDKLGNLLWGNAPQPKFSEGYVPNEKYADLVHREGDVIYVNIEENGYYILEMVNAMGAPLKTLYKGSWDIGEHSVAIDVKSIQPSSYIVLRRGTDILSWSLLN
ncbi:LamG-like jellyroll fold domain-containing protein [Fibrobacter sp. HC4]|uniref:LamG-like jellyroll fold domain-containing protein n=1 Tax=Fibrobacter sp. HC4 TaxID=3239812 RepID=UPI002018C838|nr:LamG-like jellyroll fold domain-containing protein [Fibrobacter succinogenes]